MDKSKKLYEPFKYTGKGNARYSVYVKGPNGNPKLIHFSDKRYENFHQHKDKKRQKSYLARAKGIKKRMHKPQSRIARMCVHTGPLWRCKMRCTCFNWQLPFAAVGSWCTHPCPTGP